MGCDERASHELVGRTGGERREMSALGVGTRKVAGERTPKTHACHDKRNGKKEGGEREEGIRKKRLGHCKMGVVEGDPLENARALWWRGGTGEGGWGVREGWGR